MNGFKYMNKVSTIIGDSIAHSGHAFHPRIGKPPVSIEDDGEGGEEGEEQEEEGGPSMNPSAMQGLVMSALTTASAAAGSQFPYQNTLSNLPTTSTLINEFHVPDAMMDIDPMPKMMSDHLLTLSPSTTLLEDITMSTLDGNKHKFCPIFHSAPTSVISAAHPVLTTFNTHLLILHQAYLLVPSTTKPHHLELQYSSICHILAVPEGTHEAVLR